MSYLLSKYSQPSLDSRVQSITPRVQIGNTLAFQSMRSQKGKC